MNLTTTNASATMSSREIAELTGKRHDHVKRDIRNMCKQLEIDSAQFCAQYRDGSGRTFPCFNLNFHLASTLIAGYSSKARMAIISRLEEKAVIDAINEFEVPDDIPDMYVYAIRETETGRVKLGISRDPGYRLRQLQVGNSQKLELVAYRKATNRFGDEAAIHAENKDSRIRSEWFQPGAELTIEENTMGEMA